MVGLGGVEWMAGACGGEEGATEEDGPAMLNRKLGTVAACGWCA